MKPPHTWLSSYEGSLSNIGMLGYWEIDKVIREVRKHGPTGCPSCSSINLVLTYTRDRVTSYRCLDCKSEGKVPSG